MLELQFFASSVYKFTNSLASALQMMLPEIGNDLSDDVCLASSLFSFTKKTENLSFCNTYSP